MNEVIFLVTSKAGYQFKFDPEVKDLRGYDIAGVCYDQPTEKEAISSLTDDFLIASLEIAREYLTLEIQTEVLNYILTDFESTISKKDLVPDWRLRCDKLRNSLRSNS